jgi:MoaA/NifB/PqqE/SkfB family radical SAM enzyme
MIPPSSLRVAVELTSRCNLRCGMCPLKSMERPLSDMPYEMLVNVHRELRAMNLEVRWLHEMGEPLLYPRLEEALELFPTAILSTNGMLLEGKTAETVIRSPIQTVRICIDTLKPDAYKLLRTGGDFERVAANTRKFLEDSAPGLLQVQIQKMVSKPTKNEKKGDFEKFFRLDRYPRAVIIEKTCEGLDTTAETGLHGKYAGCFQGGPFNWLVILSNGLVTHCCYDYEGKQAVGDIGREPLSEILKNPRLSGIIKAFKEKDYSTLPRCAECFSLSREVRTYPPFLYRILRRFPFKDRFRRWFM